ncbi:hypothetical protein BH20ACT15_BH20ACT15_06150 [soil metagenome]
MLTESNDPNYKTLSVEQVNEDYIVRAPASAPAQNGRDTRRRSLAYFAQLTDFQLADEESPARVEFLDPGASSAWRPQEAFHPFVIDASIKQVNRFAPSSVVPQGNGSGNAMDFALVTGDQADNAQRNEFRWTRELIEGGTPLNFNSGVNDAASFAGKPSCQAYLAQEVLQAAGNVAAAQAAITAEAARYTGVQDYDDYPAAAPPGPQPAYYDPDQPLGQWAEFPQYPGLMDRAQQLSFTPAGLDVPSYWSNGNHDALVQGNEDANAAFEDIATACFKALGTTLAVPPSSPGPDFVPDPNLLLSPTAAGMLVPPDPERRFLDRPQIKTVLGANNEDNDHGFEFVDPAENAASTPIGQPVSPNSGNASYYAWDPPQTPGFRFINVDTNSEGGQTAEGVASGSSNGNIDDPQFQWLTDELDAAQAADKLIVLYGHHPVRSMTTEIADEQALTCTADDTHGDTPAHDANPGCDRDPRDSVPIHLGTDPVPGDPRESFVELLENYPNVLAYVAGHTHEHRLIPFTRPDQSVWWEINSSATADWPQQHRLIEVMDNRDDTLSIFGTVLDAASPAQQPPEGPAAAFDSGQLASIGRTLSFNDPDNDMSGEGTPNDRNVEMLVDDPREADVSVTKADDPDPVTAGESVTYDIDVTNNSTTTTATLVTLADQLPPTATYTSATPDPGTTCTPPAAGTLNCALGDIGPGQTVSVSLVVSPQTAGTITNQVSVSSVTDDPVPGNNADTEPTTVSATTVVNPPPSGGSGSGGGSGNTQVPASAKARCRGFDATIVGTPRRDTLRGTPGRDVIVGLGGKDTIVGLGGNDIICGNGGHNRIFGGPGNDRLIGGPRSDLIFGGQGRDVLIGRGGNDLLSGGPGADKLKGGKGKNDRCKGGGGKDKCKGCEKGRV